MTELEKNNNVFNNIEKNIIQILSLEPDIYLSQYKIYGKLLENLEIKDPLEKDNLKMKFLIVLRQLSNIFEYVSVIKKDNILYASFTNDENNIDSKFEENGVEEINKDLLPPEKTIIDFIIDENMEKYMYRKDYNGNTILHSLILNNDLDRIKKSKDIIFRMIDQKNNNNLTPIDVINDIKISNYFQGLLFENLKNVKKGLKDLDHEVSLKEHKIVNTLITLFIMVILQFLMFIYFMLFLIKKN